MTAHYRVLAALACLLFSAPILLVVGSWLAGMSDGIAYLAGNGLLASYIRGSVIVILGTVTLSTIIALPCAWWVSMIHFPGRRVLDWLLLLPLALPPYIIAMAYSELLSASGVISTALVNAGLPYQDYWFTNIRSTPGAIFILSCGLFPYIYLSLRAAFMMQSNQILESAAMLGCTRTQQFWRVALPLSRPALTAGMLLVIMESAADFGVASLYGVDVLPVGIYRTWSIRYDILAATQMGAFLLLMISLCIWLEKGTRGQAQYYNQTALYHPIAPWRIRPWQMAAVTCTCWLVVAVSLIVPLAMLCYLALPNLSHLLDAATVTSALYSVTIAGTVALVVLLIATLAAYATRITRARWFTTLITAMTSGYAVPGSVIAVGVLLLFVTLERSLLGGTLLLTGSLIGIIWGCSLRFLTIGYHTMHSGLQRITPAMDDAAIMLGANHRRLLTRVHMPMLKSSLLAVCLLVFIDTMKELPATLLLRPFNVNTLAIRVYELAQDELLAYAAPPALLLIALSLIAVLYLHRQFHASRPGSPC